MINDKENIISVKYKADIRDLEDTLNVFKLKQEMHTHLLWMAKELRENDPEYSWRDCCNLGDVIKIQTPYTGFLAQFLKIYNDWIELKKAKS